MVDAQSSWMSETSTGGSPAVCRLAVPVSSTEFGSIKFGELVQDHRGRLVGMPWPLTCYATARLKATPGVSAVNANGLRLAKTERVLTTFLQSHARLRVGLDVVLQDPVPDGIGCAISTANMRLAVTASARLLGVHVSRSWLARRLSAIEPTDALGLNDGRTCVWDFFKGKALSPSYRVPHGTYVGAFPRGQSLPTDTLAGRRPSYTARERQLLDGIFAQIISTLRTRSLPGLARLASISADVNNVYFFKKEIPTLNAMTYRGEILGYWSAHSGTVFGAIGWPGQLDSLARSLAKRLGAGYEIFGFQCDAETDWAPFLINCGRRVLHLST